MRGNSTTHALVHLLYNWHNIIHTNETVRILYVDYRKAFDSVIHAILLDRFREFGFHAVLISLLPKRNTISCMRRSKTSEEEYYDDTGQN